MTDSDIVTSTDARRVLPDALGVVSCSDSETLLARQFAAAAKHFAGKTFAGKTKAVLRKQHGLSLARSA